MTSTDVIKEHLQQSCDQLSPQLQQQLNARRNLAQRGRSQRRLWQIGTAIAPVLLLASLWVNVPEQQLSAEDEALYDDMALLIEAEELDFLEQLDVTDWVE